MKRHQKGLTASRWAKLRHQDLPASERRAALPQTGGIQTMADHLTTAASRGQVLARLLKERGGHIVVVGGKLDEYVPKALHAHPQVRLWDTDAGRWEGRELPSNTRAVLFNRWVNHGLMRRIEADAKRLRCIVFPMMPSRDIRETLLDMFPGLETPKEAVMEEKAREAEVAMASPLPVDEPVVEAPPASALTRRRPRLGEIAAFLIVEKADLNANELVTARRLLPTLWGLGIAQTEHGLAQNIRNLRVLMAKPLPRSPTGPTKAVVNAIRAAQEGRYSFDVSLAVPDMGPAKKVAPRASSPVSGGVRFGDGKTLTNGVSLPGAVDFDAVEQLFRNAIASLKAVLPAIEKAREVLPALELVQDELPRVKAEIARLNKIREAMS